MNNKNILNQTKNKGGKPSKGMSAIIGAIAGFFLENIIISHLEGESSLMPINTWTFLLLLPGAIIGAIIGLNFGKSDADSSNRAASAETPRQDSASDLMGYKKLLDEGVITQEEFDKKKQEILERK